MEVKLINVSRLIETREFTSYNVHYCYVLNSLEIYEIYLKFTFGQNSNPWNHHVFCDLHYEKGILLKGI